MAGWSTVHSRRSCLEGTRIAALKEIRTWLADTSLNAPLFFVLDGIAGIGKTTIAYTIAEEAFRDGYLGASFFFSRAGEAELSDPALVFPTVAYQLGHFSSSFLPHFNRAADTSSGAAYERLEIQLQRLIVEPLQHVTPPSKSLLIVLDAFDECQKEGAKELLRLLLSEIPKVSFPLRILLSCRPEPHLRNILHNSVNLHKLILHDIEPAIVKNDIRLYLQMSFAEIPEKLELSIGRRWARHDEIEALVERAGTLFIVAATYARFAGDDVIRNPRQQLDLLLQRSEVSFIGSTHTVDELYLQILRKIRSTTGSPHIIERLRLMVGAMILLKDPMPIAVMERLLGLSFGDGYRALHHLHSVISIPREPDGHPRIHHASFPDFITDPLRCTETDFCIQRDVQESRLAARCLELITFAVESGFTRRKLQLEWAEQREPAERLKRQERVDPPLPLEWLEQRMRQAPQAQLERLRLEELEYAFSWWWYHLSRAGSYGGKAMDVVDSSTSRCLMWWFEAIHPRAPTTHRVEASAWATLCRARDAVSIIAALALNAGHPRKAVEIIEHAHGTSAAQVQEYQTTLDKLHASNPELASEILCLSSRLKFFGNSSEDTWMGKGLGALQEDAPESYRGLSGRWNDVLERIRNLPGFEAFLKPTPFEILRRAAINGPVIIVNITQLRSDAIIILEAGEPILIPLPEATPSTVRDLRGVFEWVARRLPSVPSDSGTISTVLLRIWDILVEPIAFYLEHTLHLSRGSRIWWNPTAALWLFPLHAAGNYIRPDLNLPERFVSSYTPSLSSLLQSNALVKRNVPPKLSPVPQTDTDGLGLGERCDEVNTITEHASHTAVIEGETCTRDEVVASRNDLASHDQQGSIKAAVLRSQDAQPITLLDIIRNNFPKGEIAFVSVGHSTHSDQTNHLATGMLLSEFRTVIRSMWEIEAEDRLVVLREFSKYIFRNGPEAADYSDAAMALSMAAKELKRRGIPPKRWIGVVHYGA
ncbi:hypothetical protein FRB94_013184 [Tulasnella sp. JGI-2019a]|nr:hypothetical protein FRB94_013184 [Tulasnella sp. JGI-2019a]